MGIEEISKGIYTSKWGVYSIDKNILSEKEVAPVKVITTKDNIETTGQAVSWGESNTGPQKTLQLINKIGVAGAAVKVATAAHFGTGLSIIKEDENGIKTPISMISIPEILNYNKRNNFNLFYSEFIPDLEIHDMGFTEFGVSKDFSKIVWHKRHDSSFCRFEVMNERSGRIENVYINSDWENEDKRTTATVACFSQYDYYEDILEVCKQKKIHQFIIAFHYVKNGVVYYNKPTWHAPLKNGWADIVLSVPAVKKAISENQLHFKYLIHISDKYFEMKYGVDSSNNPNWGQFDEEKKKKAYNETMEAIDQHLAGQKAYGRSLIVPMGMGADGKQEELIKILPIDDKIKDGAYLPDASAGNYEIMFAKGIDPAIIGNSIPGSSNLSGSGSNKREAYTILCANMVINRSVSLLVFEFIKNWNNWGDDISGAFPNVQLTTLDKNPSGQTSKIL